jgi:parallel beta-helix repeat protein
VIGAIYKIHFSGFLPGYFYILFLSIFFNLTVNTYAIKPVYVSRDGSGNFLTINEAIEEAVEGQTIIVKPGVYREAIWFRKGVHLIGQDPENTRIIPPKNAGAAILVINVKNQEFPGTIESLIIKGDSKCREIQDAGFVLSDHEKGVFVTSILEGGSAERAKVLKGFKLKSVDGWSVFSAEMARCLIAHNGKESPVTFEFDAGRFSRPKKILTSPRIVPGQWPKGIVIVNSQIHVINCTLKGLGGDGIWICGKESRCIISDNKCINNRGSGIKITYGATGTIKNNRCTGNLHGISIERDFTSPLIYRNLCKKNVESGIFYSKKAAGYAIENSCTENGRNGIKVCDTGTLPSLYRNKCIRNSKDGIHFRKQAGGAAIGNSCWENLRHGIQIFNKKTSPVVYKNRCNQNKGSGIRAEYGGRGEIEKNHLEKNSGYGIEIINQDICPYLFKNEFLNNTKGEIKKPENQKSKSKKISKKNPDY